MPRQNRVTPSGDLIAVPDRGMFWGNRGVLHDAAGRLVRHSRGRAWAICVLEFKGRRDAIPVISRFAAFARQAVACANMVDGTLYQ